MSEGSKTILLIQGGPKNDSTIDLSQEITSIGRSPNNDMVADEPGVSREHARIRKVSNECWIEDLGSRNGTFVNGSPVEGEGQRLRNADRIQLGTGTIHWIFRELDPTVEGRIPPKT